MQKIPENMTIAGHIRSAAVRISICLIPKQKNHQVKLCGFENR
jgi:hypothetical protein